MNASSEQRLKETLSNLHQALEQLESALLEFEETLEGEEAWRSRGREDLELLSIPEVCQNLGMGKSWVYRRLKSGDIPSVKLGRSIKVKRSDLEEYVQGQRWPAEQEIGPPTTSSQEEHPEGSSSQS